MRVIDAFDEPVRAAAVSPDGRFVAATGGFGIGMWNWVTGAAVSHGTAPAAVGPVTFTADGMQGNRPYHREAHRTKPVLDPRNPPGDGDGGGGGRPNDGDCCRKVLRILTRQERVLELMLKELKRRASGRDKS